jgi:hypothetical protein
MLRGQLCVILCLNYLIINGISRTTGDGFVGVPLRYTSGVRPPNFLATMTMIATPENGEPGVSVGHVLGMLALYGVTVTVQP